MKRIYRYLLMTVLALCLSIPAIAAEAASVAVLPLINNVEGRTDVSQVYYSGAINAIKAQQGFMMVDNDDLTAVVEKHTTKGVLPDKEALQAIAKEAKVDIVIAMQLDTLDYDVQRGKEDMIKLANEYPDICFVLEGRDSKDWWVGLFQGELSQITHAIPPLYDWKVEE